MNIQISDIGHMIQLAIAPVFLLTGVATKLTVLTGFGNFDQVHRDAISTSTTLQNSPLTTIPFGALVGIQTDGALKYGVLEIREATSGAHARLMRAHEA